MSHGTVYSRFRKWQGIGVFEAFFQALPIDADLKNISTDSTFCNKQQSASSRHI